MPPTREALLGTAAHVRAKLATRREFVSTLYPEIASPTALNIDQFNEFNSKLFSPEHTPDWFEADEKADTLRTEHTYSNSAATRCQTNTSNTPDGPNELDAFEESRPAQPHTLWHQAQARRRITPVPTDDPIDDIHRALDIFEAGGLRQTEANREQWRQLKATHRPNPTPYHQDYLPHRSWREWSSSVVQRAQSRRGTPPRLREPHTPAPQAASSQKGPLQPAARAARASMLNRAGGLGMSARVSSISESLDSTTRYPSVQSIRAATDTQVEEHPQARRATCGSGFGNLAPRSVHTPFDDSNEKLRAEAANLGRCIAELVPPSAGLITAGNLQGALLGTRHSEFADWCIERWPGVQFSYSDLFAAAAEYTVFRFVRD